MAGFLENSGNVRPFINWPSIVGRKEMPPPIA